MVNRRILILLLIPFQKRRNSDSLTERKPRYRDPRDAERILQQWTCDGCNSNSDHRSAVHLLLARTSESSVQTV